MNSEIHSECNRATGGTTILSLFEMLPLGSRSYGHVPVPVSFNQTRICTLWRSKSTPTRKNDITLVRSVTEISSHLRLVAHYVSGGELYSKTLRTYRHNFWSADNNRPWYICRSWTL